MIASSTQPQPVNQPRLRQLHLDGLRGLAALFVLVGHCFLTLVRTPEFDPKHYAPPWTDFLRQGRLSVDVFIVLSGYVLMLPVVARGDIKNLQEFGKRRARRILPPYYAALAISIFLLMLTPIHHLPSDVWMTAAEMARCMSGPALVAHLVMLQDLKAKWMYWADPPLWSVATEWWIYAAFALALVPTWRRFGLAAAVGLGCAAGLALHFGRPQLFDQSAPWYLGLFSFGMAAATWTVRPPSQPVPWAALGTAILACYVILIATGHPAHSDLGSQWWVEMLAGAGVALLLVAWSGSDHVPILSSSPALRIGAFSYSLYLIHEPVLLLFASLILPLHLSFAACSAAFFLVGAPLCMGASYLFHLAFERRFMSQHGPKSERQAEIAAALNPAP